MIALCADVVYDNPTGHYQTRVWTTEVQTRVARRSLGDLVAIYMRIHSERRKIGGLEVKIRNKSIVNPLRL